MKKGLLKFLLCGTALHFAACTAVSKNDGTIIGESRGTWWMFGTKYESSLNTWDSVNHIFSSDCDGNHKVFFRFGPYPLQDTLYKVVNYNKTPAAYEVAIDVAQGVGLDYLSTGYDAKNIRVTKYASSLLGYSLSALDSIRVRGAASNGPTNDSTKFVGSFD